MTLYGLVADASNSQVTIKLAGEEEIDWEEQVRQSFKPTFVDEKLYILPDWCEPVEEDALSVVLYPGLAFGTGSSFLTAVE